MSNDNIFNLDEVLYVSYNLSNSITISFNNTSDLCIDFGDCFEREVNEKSKKEFDLLCNKMLENQRTTKEQIEANNKLSAHEII